MLRSNSGGLTSVHGTEKGMVAGAVADIIAIAIASGLSNSAWAADEEDFERLVDQSLGASGPTLIGVRIDDKPGVGATRRDPVQIRNASCSASACGKRYRIRH